MDVSDLFNPGLYKIICLKNNKIYIGQSTNVLSRLGRHVDNLENNRHDCIELQKDFNNYGKKYFKFESLEINDQYSTENLRKEKEKQFIKKLKNTYNIEENKTWNFYSQKLKIKGKIYQSMRQASASLNESHTHFTRKCSCDSKL